MNFHTAANHFKNDRIRELSTTDDGMRFLKLRSLSRKAHMEYLVNKYSIDVGETTSRAWLKILFDSDIQSHAIDAAISELYEQERSKRRANEDQLVNELYKIQSFEWGGLHQNSLEKTIVNNYVKKIISYDELSNAIENDLHNSMRAYVLASWYNHWSSIVIEDIFTDHRRGGHERGSRRSESFHIMKKEHTMGEPKDVRIWAEPIYSTQPSNSLCPPAPGDVDGVRIDLEADERRLKIDVRRGPGDQTRVFLIPNEDGRLLGFHSFELKPEDGTKATAFRDLLDWVQYKT